MTFKAFNGKVYNPNLKFSAAGKAYFTCTVKEGHRRKSRDSGQYENSGVTWHRVSYFGSALFPAEQLAEVAVEGATLVVYGNGDKREYEKDGEKRESDEIIPEAGCVGVVPVAPQYAQGAQQGQAQQPAAAPQQGQWGGNQQAPAQWGNQPQNGQQWGQPAPF